MRAIFARGMEAHIRTMSGEAKARAVALFYPAKRKLCPPSPANAAEFIDLRNVVALRPRPRP